MALWSIARGLALTALSLLVFYLAPGRPEFRRSLAVLMLVCGNIGLLMAEVGGLNQVFKRAVANRRTWFATALLLSLTLAMAYLPVIREFFSLVRPEAYLFVLVLTLAFALGSISSHKELRVSISKRI